MPRIIADGDCLRLKEIAEATKDVKLRAAINVIVNMAVSVERWPVDSVAHQDRVLAVWVQPKEKEDAKNNQ